MIKTKISKNNFKNLKKVCACCGKEIEVKVFTNRHYRGGHYFGKIPLYKKDELNKAVGAGTRKTRIGKMTVEVLKKDPKPYKYEEYWECNVCYK